MGSDVERIKERLDIAEVVSGYVKLDKAGASFKGRCPFHNEKTPSFFVSPVRQSYYCFGCGAKGDILTFVQELEGLSFREALKSLAERAGVELESRPEAIRARSEKGELLEVLERATEFFERELTQNETARKYLLSRGLTEMTIKNWRLGFAPAEWRALYSFLLSVGFKKEVLLRAGLVKPVDPKTGKEPYDVFRDRLIFPLMDSTGEIVAFSGRALAKQSEPKYLNSPDTVLFTKSEVLYGLDKAKDKIRRKDYAVLVEGQMDLVLSHQAGVENTVASSGTAFTARHLERLKKLSKRIILAFDGDNAGEKAAEKSTELALNLGLEVKIAQLPRGKDPAELVKENPELWKEVLRNSKPAIEHFLIKTIESEKDTRKLGQQITERILPKIALLESSIERSHFISLIGKLTGFKEEVVWEDLKRVQQPSKFSSKINSFSTTSTKTASQKKEMIQERLEEVKKWLKEVGRESKVELEKEKIELENNLKHEALKEELGSLKAALSLSESSKDSRRVDELSVEIQEILKKIRALEEREKLV